MTGEVKIIETEWKTQIKGFENTFEVSYKNIGIAIHEI